MRGCGGPTPAGREGLTPGSPPRPCPQPRFSSGFPSGSLYPSPSEGFPWCSVRYSAAPGSCSEIPACSSPAGLLGSARHGLASAEPGMLRDSGCAVLLAAPLRFPQVPELNRGQRCSEVNHLPGTEAERCKSIVALPYGVHELVVFCFVPILFSVPASQCLRSSRSSPRDKQTTRKRKAVV